MSTYYTLQKIRNHYIIKNSGFDFWYSTSRHGTIIGNSVRRVELQEQLERLKTDDGTFMQHFLTHTHCFRTRKKALAYIARNIPIDKQDFADKCNTLARYESHGFIVYNNQLLEQNSINVANMPFKKLSLSRTDYLSSIISNLEEFFPIELLREIDIFDNRNWDDTKDVDAEHQGDDQKLKKLCNFFGLKYTRKVFTSWIKLIKDLFEQEYPWCEIKGSYPSSFWMNVLPRATEFNIDPVLERLIRSIVVTPMGSSEAERAFSVMNKVYR